MSGDTVQPQSWKVDVDEESDNCIGDEDARSQYFYNDLDAKGRATGAIACLDPRTAKMIDPREPVKPVGFTTGVGPLAEDRSHLIAREFGGIARDYQGVKGQQNIVPMYRAANQNQESGMRSFELRVKEALAGGQKVFYAAVPLYMNGRDTPIGVEMTMLTSGGSECSLYVPNVVNLSGGSGPDCS